MIPHGKWKPVHTWENSKGVPQKLAIKRQLDTWTPAVRISNKSKQQGASSYLNTFILKTFRGIQDKIRLSIHVTEGDVCLLAIAYWALLKKLCLFYWYV